MTYPPLFKRDSFWVILFFISALSIRFIFLYQFINTLFFIPAENNLDPSFYHAWAQQIVSGHFLPDGLFPGMPLFAYWLALVYKIWGVHVFIAKSANIVLGSCTAVCVYAIGRAVFDKKVAIFVGILYVVCPIFIVYELFLVGTALETFLLSVSFLLSIIAFKEQKNKLFLLTGLCMGFSSLARMSIVVYLVFYVITIVLSNKRQNGIKALILIVGFVLAILPVLIHNYSATHKLTLSTAHSGINFYIGNNPEARGTFRAPDEIVANSNDIFKGARVIASRNSSAVLSDLEVSQYWSHHAKKFIFENPLTWLRLLARKLLLFINVRDIPDIVSYEFLKMQLPILRMPWLSLSIVIPLSILGFVVCFFEKLPGTLLCVYISSYAVSVALYFVNTRYKVPVYPVVLILAGAGGMYVIRNIYRKKIYVIVLSLLIVTGSVFLTHLTLFRYDLSVAFNNVALMCRQRGWNQRAIDEFKRALAINPRNSAIIYNMAHTYIRMNDLEKAQDLLEKAVSINPHVAIFHKTLSTVYDANGLKEKAMQEQTIAKRLDPSLYGERLLKE